MIVVRERETINRRHQVAGISESSGRQDKTLSVAHLTMRDDRPEHIHLVS